MIEKATKTTISTEAVRGTRQEWSRMTKGARTNCQRDRNEDVASEIKCGNDQHGDGHVCQCPTPRLCQLYLSGLLQWHVIPAVMLDAERTRYFGERRLFRVADLNTSAEQTAALGGRLGGLLTDRAQPALERNRVAWSLGGE
jgi:hypothetical protein